MGRLVGRHDGGGDTATVADLVALRTGPVANIIGGGPVVGTTLGIALGTLAHAAGGTGPGFESLNQLGDVGLAQVDFVLDAIESESDIAVRDRTTSECWKTKRRSSTRSLTRN